MIISNSLDGNILPLFRKCIYKETYKGHKNEIWICNYFCDDVIAIYDVAANDPKNSYREDYHQRKWGIIKERTAFFIYGITDGNMRFVSTVEYSSKEIPNNVARVCSRLYCISQYRGWKQDIKTLSERCWGFPENPLIEIPQYMQIYGFDAVFVTRHYNPKKRNSMNHMKNFTKLETPKIYHGVPQTIYYTGNDPTIFDGLLDYEPELS